MSEKFDKPENIQSTDDTSTGKEGLGDIGKAAISGNQNPSDADNTKSDAYIAAETAIEQPKNETPEAVTLQENLEAEELNELKQQYLEDLRQNSQFPNSIDSKALVNKWEKLSPDECAKMRTDFETKKPILIKAWEEKNNTQWPTYEKDVFSDNGRLIRKQGNKYDAHHIHPLSMGGANSPENITPLNALSHYDKQGIHSPQSPYSKIATKLAFEE